MFNTVSLEQCREFFVKAGLPMVLLLPIDVRAELAFAREADRERRLALRCVRPDRGFAPPANLTPPLRGLNSIGRLHDPRRTPAHHSP